MRILNTSRTHQHQAPLAGGVTAVRLASDNRFGSTLPALVVPPCMTRYSTDCNPVTGCLRRRAKRKLTTNARWMGLGAGEVSSLHLLHTLAIDTAMSYASFSFILAFLLFIQNMTTGNNIPGLDVLIDIISLGPVLTFETLLNAWMIVDHVLFDIPDNEYVQPRMMTAPKNLRIDCL